MVFIWSIPRGWGPVTVYDTQTNQVVSSTGTNTFLSGESSAVNRDGTLFGVHLGGTRIYNRSLQVVTTLTTIDGGAAFDPVSDVFYGVNSATDQLVVYRTGDWTIASSTAIGENLSTSSAMGSGVMSIALNGGQVFISTPTGIRIITLDTRALAGNYSVAEGGSLTLNGNAVPAPGRTISNYEWDFDYDGTFTLDASGQNVSLPTAGIDGPSTRQIALRVRDSNGATNLSSGTVNIVNSPPSLSVGGPATIGVGKTLTLDLSATDPGPETITGWTINWGEGPVQTVAAGAALSVSRQLNIEGNHTITVSAVDEDGTYNAAPVQFLVSTPPTIESVIYDFNAPVPVVRVRFSENVAPSISRTDFQMIQESSGLGVPVSKTVLSYDASTNTAVISFPGFPFGVIPDGNYRVTAFAPEIRDGINNMLDGNGDGVAGDDATGDFYVLRGDLNRDRTVSIADFITLASNFGKTNATYVDGDVNYDGQVTIADFIDLASNFNKTLDPPAAAIAPQAAAAMGTAPAISSASARSVKNKANHSVSVKKRRHLHHNAPNRRQARTPALDLVR
jgi:hypothetical protein